MFAFNFISRRYNKYFPGDGSFSATAAPGGRGKSAMCTVTKTRGYFEKQQTAMEALKQELADLTSTLLAKEENAAAAAAAAEEQPPAKRVKSEAGA